MTFTVTHCKNLCGVMGGSVWAKNAHRSKMLAALKYDSKNRL